MWVRVEPLDVVIFRTPKPFTAGDAFRAESGPMPPLPLPFAGAVRAVLMDREEGFEWGEYVQAYLRENGRSRFRDVEERYGGPDDMGRLRLWGPFLTTRQAGGRGESWEVMVPLPLDTRVRQAREGGLEAVALAAEDPPARFVVRTKKPLLRPLRGPGEGDGVGADDTDAPEPPAEPYLTWNGLMNYLTGVPAVKGVVAGERLYRTEPRTGVAVDRTTGTVSESHLYTVACVRLSEGTAFALRLAEGFPTGGTAWEGTKVWLGGEGRVARFSVMNPPAEVVSREDLVEELAACRGFRIVLLAPAIYEGGWLPDVDWGRDRTEGGFTLHLDGRPVAVLVSAAVGKPRPVAGWDMARRRPRPLVWAVPAGSVYRFRTADGREIGTERARALVDAYHLTTNTMKGDGLGNLGVPPLYRQAGFGLTAVGCLRDV